MQDQLIAVTKDGEYLEVHPTTLANHKELGWRGCAKREPVEDENAKKASEGLKVDELKAALAAKGITPPENAKKADLQALLDAAV